MRNIERLSIGVLCVLIIGGAFVAMFTALCRTVDKALECPVLTLPEYVETAPVVVYDTVEVDLTGLPDSPLAMTVTQVHTDITLPAYLDAAKVPVLLDILPSPHFAESPKFVLTGVVTKEILVKNTAFDGGRSMDIALSLLGNEDGVYSLCALTETGDSVTLHKKRAMGPVAPEYSTKLDRVPRFGGTWQLNVSSGHGVNYTLHLKQEQPSRPVVVQTAYRTYYDKKSRKTKGLHTYYERRSPIITVYARGLN